jgi:hypothetical protein
MLLLEVLKAANYLDYPQLLRACCKELGDRLKNMDIDQVIKEFNVPKENWYTPEERELIDQELKWINHET